MRDDECYFGYIFAERGKAPLAVGGGEDGFDEGPGWWEG